MKKCDETEAGLWSAARGLPLDEFLRRRL